MKEYVFIVIIIFVSGINYCFADGSPTPTQTPSNVINFLSNATFNFYGKSNFNHLNPSIFLGDKETFGDTRIEANGNTVPANYWKLGVSVHTATSDNTIQGAAQKLLLEPDFAVLGNITTERNGLPLLNFVHYAVFATGEFTINSIPDQNGNLNSIFSPLLLVGTAFSLGDRGEILVSLRYMPFGAIVGQEQLFRNSFSTNDSDTWAWGLGLTVPLGQRGDPKDILGDSYCQFQINNYISSNMGSIVNNGQSGGGGLIGIGIVKNLDINTGTGNSPVTTVVTSDDQPVTTITGNSNSLMPLMVPKNHSSLF